MTQEQCVKVLLAGIEVVADLSTQGYEMIGMGEMGIGNTTPSSALVSVLLNLPANEVTGRGAGLSDEAYNKKVAVIEQAVDRYWKATENSSNWQETSRNPLYVFLPDGSLHNPLSYKPPLPPMSRMSDPPYDHYLLQHPTTDDHDRQQIQALSDNLQNHKLLYLLKYIYLYLYNS